MIRSATLHSPCPDHTLSHAGSLPWKSGVYDDRRARDEVYTALGVWIVPVTEEAKPDSTSLSDAKRALCVSLRSEGFGIVSTVGLEGQEFILAVDGGTDAESS